VPAPETLGPRVALHLLNRAGYGPRPGEIDGLLQRGPTKWIEEQLDPQADPELDQRLSRYPTLSYTTSRILALYNADPRSIGVILDEFTSAKVVRAVHGRNQLEEVLVDFWFNHFNVFVNDGFDRYSISSYERDAIRPHVLGRFRDLLGAASLHPAMLYYLDNYLNTVPRRVGNRVTGGINENQGRELLELHTVGVDAGYSQTDVVEASRCLTGHGIDNLNTSGAYVYRAANHDNDSKQVFGLSVPAGGGEGDVQKLFDHLASHPATAWTISKRLCQRFVADDPPAGLVERLADVFLRSDGDLREVVKALFGSAELWAEAFGSGKPRTPFEFVVATLRAAGAEVQNPRAVRAAFGDMGMPLYACNPPTGYGNRGAEWLNPSSQLYRMNFALDLAAGAVSGVTADVRALIREGGGDPDNPRSAAEAINREVFGHTLTSATLASASSVDTSGPVAVPVRVAGLLFASPEMQVR
jgi:uncharacterized protein (DUF1800 family)